MLEYKGKTDLCSQGASFLSNQLDIRNAFPPSRGACGQYIAQSDYTSPGSKLKLRVHWNQCGSDLQRLDILPGMLYW